MAIHATLGFCHNEFVAELSDGRQLAQPDFRAIAEALVHARVQASEVQYEWKSGQRMITIGQQVALLAEMRRLEREYAALSIAA